MLFLWYISLSIILFLWSEVVPYRNTLFSPERLVNLFDAWPNALCAHPFILTHNDYFIPNPFGVTDRRRDGVTV